MNVPVSIGVTAVGGVAWIASEALKSHIVPDHCRWCDRAADGSDTVDGLDASVRDALKWNATSSANTLSNLLGFGLAPIAAFGESILAAHHDRRLDEAPIDALVIGEATVLAVDTNQLVKFIALRERPFVHALPADQKNHTSQPSDNNLSFFSGHTTAAFALAVSAGTVATMRKRSLAPLVWGVGGTLAFAAGYLRIAADRHYFTDVLVGAAVGSLYGFGIPFFFHSPDRPVNVAWSVAPTPGGVAIRGVF